MTIDQTALAGLRSTLAADDYAMDVREAGGGLEVRISAGPQACAECLVPKPIMLGILRNALGVPEYAITLHYPAETA
jgi:hypothetical protein